MADAMDIDVVLVQEGARDAARLAPAGWETYETDERPNPLEMNVDGRRAVPAVGFNRTYNTFVREGSGVRCRPKPFRPTQSPTLMRKIRPSIQTADAGRRPRKQPINDERLNLLGLRPPQVMEITKQGGSAEAVVLYNYHAPQGSGSALGYSGMDAPRGHEVMGAVMFDEPKRKVLGGDQNAHRSTMRALYPGMDIISAGQRDKLSHAAVSSELSPRQIDLGGEGDSFNNKGKPGCSDHSAYAFSIKW
jgi:hypothetical protein